MWAPIPPTTSRWLPLDLAVVEAGLITSNMVDGPTSASQTSRVVGPGRQLSRPRIYLTVTVAVATTGPSDQLPSFVPLSDTKLVTFAVTDTVSV